MFQDPQGFIVRRWPSRNPTNGIHILYIGVDYIFHLRLRQICVKLQLNKWCRQGWCH